jgi:hypothetical protein
MIILAEALVESWPEAAVAVVGIIVVGSVILGRWPWSRD